MLLPEREASDACVQYAQKLVAGRAARAVLGPGALPHVTLLHVETDEDPAVVWGEAREKLAHAYVVDFLCLGLLRYDTPYNAPPAPPGTMAWIIVPCSRALREAEQTARALPFAQRSGVTTHNDDRFQPHVTLAIWDVEKAPGTLVLPRELFGGSPIGARLALGVIGANGTYERSLFEA